MPPKRQKLWNYYLCKKRDRLLKYHVNSKGHTRHWWGAIPYSTDWFRRRYDAPCDIPIEGYFVPDRHLPLVAQRVVNLTNHFMEELDSDCMDHLIAIVNEKQLYAPQGIFTD